MKNLLSLIFGLFSIAGFSQQYISVSYKSADDLVREFIGAQNASCITFSNASVKNWQDYGTYPFSYGYFEKGTLPFNIEKGIILSTGAANKAPGPNNSLLSDGEYNWLGDTDLANAFQNSPSLYINATSLEFDFVANNTTAISFEYMLLSEEYQTSGCNYFDSFAFLIKQEGEANYNNIALVPGTNDPVSSQSVRGGTDCPRNPQYFDRFNYPPDSPRIDSPTNYDGQTKVLTAKTNIIPGKKYHIKLVIADYRTTSHDSAVFLKAGSFVGKKDLGPDLSICEGITTALNATTANATSYQWFKEGIAIPGETNALLQIQGLPASIGNYQVEINLAGCILKGSIHVEIQGKAIVDNRTFSFCDEKLAGSIPINFTNLNSAVVTNLNQTFTPKYYLSQKDAQNGTGIPLADGWLLTADTDVFVSVESTNGCAPVNGQIRLVIGKKTPLLTNTFTDTICDDTRSGSVSVNLNNYLTQFAANSLTPLFFASVADARNNLNPILAHQIISGNSQTFGIRLQNNIDCVNVGEITIIKKTPNESIVLKDKPICGNSKTILDAGSGFDYYKWSTGEEGISKSNISNIVIGNYWVDLTSNGCVYRQFVKITAAELPQINYVEVTGNTATVFVTGGNPAYLYSLDNINFKTSNIFTNLPRGLQNVYVKDSQNCETITKEFLILNLINVITPNDDGKNDVLDYSDLSIKKDVKIELYDRYGNQVFISQKQPYIWDGKKNRRVLPTATYWYILNWIEPGTNLPVTY
ncbi:MAG: gliding motility-associated C-terminal domain-containing protein, partial [Flavobacteriales bacterium]|nr:gliding motility-associated C-terminal domain-containing protein [Flavobacteriales bacterium]